ncbi:carboxymuconolactone decarboxylase family protein [Sedimentitalea arenosa]|jgi:AhpD family alkylhydroperoxidase|uniref:Carboxymuconolactone decarboxylase family protein n=1 Tax=Sedimentitalea arenosa TaxID=2798803 RepID=A0A8J7LRY1_9RHOB|nr:carboxymuconolactone decarboxylase family protein [Arenibacterium arenosum]MBJ6372268.1 carboxymuconolactone decarboxylase family protein [Arenibacterium arenosum]
MTWQDKLNSTRSGLRNLNGAIPDTARAFGGLGKAVKQEGALDYKTKEFVALGISVADRCEPCISLHIEALIKLGATREEVAEVLGMCIQMGGGPAMMYAAKALECFDELSAA